MRYTLVLMFLIAGCTESGSVQPFPPVRETQPQKSAGDLSVRYSGTRLADARQVVVLLHGYGASGDDLMSLTDYIGGELRAFVFPEGPIPLPGGGQAWATTDAELDSSCRRIIELMDEIAKQHPEVRISVGGFSQGATIASKLVAEERLKLEHAILYSPAMKLDDGIPQAKHSTQVLIAHGREDAILPFSESERLRDLLIGRGYNVNWQPFDGGHTLTRELMVATRKQLDGIAN
ncbi:alpha/beta hydrolase [Schlesneria paludicola]|uniref:alpha/beta hydrolase n=1 Tax=Schlesneria paludicola TaxID=360056 RepID=UPI0002F3DE35|nr:alpha/beta hydrolase [Schlesneria paludicola]